MEQECPYSCNGHSGEECNDVVSVLVDILDTVEKAVYPVEVF